MRWIAMVFWIGCGGNAAPLDPDASYGREKVMLGLPTGATCDPSSTLTYDTFGRAFMTSFCTRCHASALSGDARMGAPVFHNFDTLAGIRFVANHVDEIAGSGPNATNTGMPFDGSRPTSAEREQLAIWIACGLP